MKISLWFLSLALLLLTGCGVPRQSDVSPVAPSLQSTAVVSTATLEPTKAVLPDPLYFINSADGQIWRAEPDATLTKVTSEAQAVTDFDVLPTNGDLAYVSGNILIRADAHGGGRTVLVTGGAVTPDDHRSRMVDALTYPLWSPSGDQIAYGHNGVNLIPASGGTVTTLVANSPYPDLLNPDPNAPPPHDARFYQPASWSPDGARLLVEVIPYEGGEFMILNLIGGEPIRLPLCCRVSWSTDGQSLFVSHELWGYLPTGLWRADATTGAAEQLISSFDDSREPTPEDLVKVVGFAQQLRDGQLYFFFASQEATEVLQGNSLPRQLTMYRAAPSDVSQMTALRSDAHVMVEVLWASDASGAVIVDATNQPADQSSLAGPLIWLASDGSPALSLPAEGHTLRWGQ